VVAIHDPLPDNASKFNLASYGLGMRVEDLFGLSFAVDWAHALEPSGQIERGDDRLHFSVRYAF
jgi:hemolysin activation/secretion protein